jgi:hypothetical protein
MTNRLYITIIMLALVGFVLTAQTAYGVGVDLRNGKVVADNNPPAVTNETNPNVTGTIRLQDGPMEPNTLGIGEPNSTGVTVLPNGTVAAYLNGGGSGSTIGPIDVENWHNGTATAVADFHMGSGKMSDLKFGHGPNVTNYTVTPTDDVTGNPHRSQAWNAGYEQAFLGRGLDLRANHTLDFFYGYTNGSEFLHFDQGYAAALSGKPSNSPRFGDTSHDFERQYNMGTKAGTTDMSWMWTNATNAWAKEKYAPPPATTEDNYMNYYIGFDNGAWAADAENQHSTTYYHGGCNGDNEYCTGFKAGWNYEANALGPSPPAPTSGPGNPTPPSNVWLGYHHL